MRFDTIIRNGVIVTAADIYRADIGLRDGVVVAIADALDPVDSAVIDAGGCYVFPGGVDIHTHFDSPSFGMTTADDFSSGSVAAACGGTTTIVNFCFQEPGDSLAETIANWHRKADGRTAVDYGFHGAVQDPTDEVLEEIASLPGQGLTTVKLFMSYKHMSMVDDLALYRMLELAKQVDALVMVHAENGDAIYHLQNRFIAEGKTAPKYHARTRPPRLEAEATARAIALAEVAGAPIYIVHVSCREALEEVERGRARGVDVLAETCTHYLYVDEDDLERPGFEGAKYVFTPPPRQRGNHDVLWRAIEDGRLQVVSSDHSAWSLQTQKVRGRNDFTQIPNGAPGVEERLVMVYQGVNAGRLSLNRFVDAVATKPARIFGMYPQKGTIAIGSDADLIVWDPSVETTMTQDALHHRVDHTVYEGHAVRGVPRTVLLRGAVIYDSGRFVGDPAMGRFVRRKPYTRCPAGPSLVPPGEA